MFQSSSNLSVGCSTVFSSGWGSTIVKSFQFSPNLSAGCSHSMVAGMCAGSFNPQPNLSVGCSFYRRFNSHPTSRLGAAILWSLGCGPAISILNPTDRLSAAGCGPLVVSILTQLLGWVQPSHRWILRKSQNVSILTTSRLGAARRPATLPSQPYQFQSSPNLSVGCIGRTPLGATSLGPFQSLPNQEVGCSSSTWFFYLLIANL